MNGRKTLVAMDKVVAIRDCESPVAKKNKYYGELVFENKDENLTVKETNTTASWFLKTKTRISQ